MRRPVPPTAAAAGSILDGAGSGAPRSAALGSFGIDLDAMDPTVPPGDDFYGYVNGRWLADFEMPADKARYGAFDALRDKSEQDVRAIVEELVAGDPAPGSTERKIADLYSGWMDTEAIEARGTAPLRPLLAAIDAVDSKDRLWPLFGSLVHAAPFHARIDVDPDDATRYSVWISQSGLGMPNRDYYLNEGSRAEAYRDAYRRYVARLFELLGDGDPEGAAKRVIALETSLAAVQWTPEQRRIVKDAVNPMARAELDRLAPDVAWDAVLGGLGLRGLERVVVAETSAIRDAGRLIAATPLDDWKQYLRFHLADRNATYLPAAFDRAHFEFHGKALRGIEVQRDRWKRGVQLVDALLGECVGRVYVERHFPPEYKAAMDDLVANVRAALGQRLATLGWMDVATRAEAQKKLAAFEPRVGYPVRWRDYAALTIERGRLIENAHAAETFEWNRHLARIDQPVDRDEWGMNPQTVNAYYDPSMNQITFPAAILQPPFFDPHADAAVNYGAIGAVIGHEIGHGFDDQGREFDETGELRNWWTAETDARFVAATERLAQQFDAVEPLPGARVNGRLTMGENIGDLGGVEIAHTAYRLSLGDSEAPVIDGFTGDQRFFMAWAQVWRAKSRDDALRSQLLTDPHSPASVRGRVPLQNVDAWYDAFDVRPGAAMYLSPEDRVRIW